MAKFIIRRLFLVIITMFLVSISVFMIVESSPGNVAKNVLGAFITPEQEASFLAQQGLDRPLLQRYWFWLMGSDWSAQSKTGFDLVRIETEKGFQEWWARGENDTLMRWSLDGENILVHIRQPVNKDEGSPDHEIVTRKDNGRWIKAEDGSSFFWGVDRNNSAVMWEKGSGREVWSFVAGSGWMVSSGGPQSYIPLKKGFLRGDFGVSLRTGRPVDKSIFIRLRNSLVLAGIAFVIVMPLALVLGMIAGIKEGSFKDRFLSVTGMIFSVIPEFATGIFLILIMSHWLELVPGAAVFGEKAPWERLDMLVLPVLTLTLIELGYVLRITRASMAEVMRSAYIRTAFLKGLPFWKVVLKHAAKNALIAPITVIMLHVNWLMGGIVIVEVVFGYPGLGQYLLDSALYKDVNAIEAGTMIMVLLAVGTQLFADVLYTFLNPRIRYS
ncbi:MAG: ABC transporter permease [Desulfamplus sp.]|nr:ABC transporter permease [Desulfamplus sp.]